MIVTIEPVALDLPVLDHKRSPGIHVSSIIRCMAIDGGILVSDDIEEPSLVDSRIITDQVAILRIWIGCAWEDFYIPRLMNVVGHPEEMRVDGIYLSPDGESVDVYIRPKPKIIRAVHEVKATYKSIKTVNNLMDPNYAKRNWMWLAQLKSYCYAAKTLHGVLHVLFICGNYRFPITPQLRKFKITFEQEELDENWALMRDYVAYRTEDPYLVGG